MKALEPAFLDALAFNPPRGFTLGLMPALAFCSSALPGRLDSYSAFSALITRRGAVLASPL